MKYIALLSLLVFIFTALPSFGVEILWKKNLNVGLPDTPMVYADITPDPGYELAFATTSGKLAVCSIQGDIVWVASGYLVFCNPPTVADLFPGDGLELLAINAQGILTCFSSSGEELWQYSFPSGVDWCQTTLVATDLDRDDQVEILGGDKDGHFVCLDRFGFEKWTFSVPGGFHCPPVVGDLDNDGFPEIVITSPDGHLMALSHEGKISWEKSLGCDNISGPVIADLDTDGIPEILVGGKDAQLHCFSNHGDLKWKSSLERETDSSIAAGDLCGDEALEIVCMDLAGNCFCFDADGKQLWKKNFGMRSRRPPSLADFNGDGEMEVLVSGYFSEYALLSSDGEEIERFAGASTNGGAALIDYQGRLAAVIPGESGILTCLTWQKEVSPEFPEVLWGLYRFDMEQTGFVPPNTPRERRRISETPPDNNTDSYKQILSSLRNNVRILRHQIQAFSAMEDELAEYDIQLHDLLLTKSAFLKRLSEGEECLEEVDSVSAEQLLLTARRIAVALESADPIQKRVEAIMNLREGQGIPRLVLWPTNPWWHIRGIEEEREDWLRSKEISLSLYRNEVESGAVNLLNLDNRSVAVRVLAPKRMGGDESPAITCYEVISVPTEMEDYSDDALSELNKAGTICVGPGETRQVFISVDSSQAAAGDYECDIVCSPVAVRSSPLSIRIKAKVLDLDIQKATAPKVCTWGYVYGSVIKDYPEEAWRDRIAHGNNVIVITTHYLPAVTYDERGQLTSEPDFSRLGEFVRERPGAFFLFHNYGPTLQGPKDQGRFSEPYNKAFAVWVHKLVTFLKGQGVGYDGFALYPVDEPGLSPGLVDLHIQYAKLAREADPKILMYTDPVLGADMDDIRRMADYVDIWCPNRMGFLLDEDPRLDVMKKNSVMLWTYECLHHAKHRAPLQYYRGFAWLAELRGLSGFGFWSYCTSSDDPWEFPAKRGHDYLLIYPGNGIVTSRRWEACRDGSEDMRAVTILKALMKEKGDDKRSKAQGVIRAAAEELGGFCIYDGKSKGIDLYGKDWLTPERVDKEWAAYRKHRRQIAEATLDLLSK
ncbi:MAG: glycoside hydrolase domain-containing protein [bacterium]